MGDLDDLGNNLVEQIQSKLGGIFDKFSKEFKLNFDTEEIYKKIVDVDKGARDVIKTFGTGAQNIKAIKDGLTDAVTEVNLLGGEFQDIVNIQLGVSEALGRNVILTSDAYEKLFSATKVSGISAENMINSFKDAGISAYQASENMEDVISIANEIGVNAQTVSQKVVSNMEQLNKFNFNGGVEGLSKMAAQATNLRIDMQSTISFAEKVFDPEGAIETAAALQRLGVAQSELLDPLRLMDLAQNDPTELQNQLVSMTKQFVRLGEAGNFEIAPGAKIQLREISKELGISYQELSKMALGSADLDRKLQQIKFPETFSEEDRIMIANMAEMGQGGDYKIKVGGEDKLVSELKPEDLKVLKEAGEGPKTIEEIQKQQLSYSEQQTALLRAMVDRLPTAIAGGDVGPQITESALKQIEIVTKAAGDVLGNVKDSKKMTDEIYNTLTTSIQGFIDGDTTFLQAVGKLSDGATSVGNYLTDNFKTSMINADDELKKLVGSSNNLDVIFGTLYTKTDKFIKDVYESDFVKNIQQNLNTSNNNSTQENNSQTVNKVGDFIKLPNQTIQPLPQDTLFGGTNFEGFLERVTQTIQPLPQNTTSNEDIFKRILEKVNNNTNQTSIGESKITSDVNLNIKIDAPSQIDTNQLILAFNNQGLREKVVESIKDAMYNNGLTSPTSSKRKLMNPNIG